MKNENTAHKCENCRHTVSASAMNCPECGHTIAVRKSKAGAVVLAWLLGGLGLHRFYLGDNLLGLAYLVAFLASFAAPGAVFLLALVAFVDGLVMLFRSPAYYRRVV